MELLLNSTYKDYYTPCEKPTKLDLMINRGRFQAQGNNLEKSAAWSTDNPVTKPMGIERLDNLEGQLTPAEFDERQNSMQKARNFVNNAPVEGHFAQIIKTFYDDVRRRSIRVDVEIRAGIAFITQNED